MSDSPHGDDSRRKVETHISKDAPSVAISRRLRGLVDQVVSLAHSNEEHIQKRKQSEFVRPDQSDSGQHTQRKFSRTNRPVQIPTPQERAAQRLKKGLGESQRQATSVAAASTGNVTPFPGKKNQPIHAAELGRPGASGSVPGVAPTADLMGQHARRAMPANVTNVASRMMAGDHATAAPFAPSKGALTQALNGGNNLNDPGLPRPAVSKGRFGSAMGGNILPGRRSPGTSRYENAAAGGDSKTSAAGMGSPIAGIPLAAMANAEAQGRSMDQASMEAAGSQDQLNQLTMMAHAGQEQENLRRAQALGNSASGGKVNPQDGRVFERSHRDQFNQQQEDQRQVHMDEGPSSHEGMSFKAKVAAMAMAASMGVVIVFGGSIGLGTGGGAGGAGAGAFAAAAASQDGVCPPIDTASNSGMAIGSDAGSPDMQNALLKQYAPLLDKQNRRSNAYDIITAVWNHDKIPENLKPRAAVIAVATSMQESKLVNVGYGDNAGPDSRGLFQQRDPWGPLEVRMNPQKSAKLFLDRLVKVKNWNTIPLTQAAQKVQISGFPDAYAPWEEFAKWVLQEYKKDGGNAKGGNSTTAAAGDGTVANIERVALEDGSDKVTYKPQPDDRFWNESRNSNDSRAVYLASRSKWSQIKDYGGYAKRSGNSAKADHPKGKAVDIMIPNYKSEAGISLGNDVSAYFQANAEKYGVTYIIWRNKSWAVGAKSWKPYNGGGVYSGSQLDDNTLHMNHVHVSVKGDGGQYDKESVSGGATNTIENGATPEQADCGQSAGEAQLAGNINTDGGVSSIIKGDWASPLPKGSVRSKFGYRGCFAGISCNKWATTHYGLDIADGVGKGSGVGSPVYAPTKMKVTLVRDAGGNNYNGGYGISIMAQSLVDPGYVFDFHHFAPGTLNVKVGDVIDKGQFIARAGTTGNSTGIHLHFQVQKPGANASKMIHSEAIDPAPIMKKAGIYPGQE